MKVKVPILERQKPNLIILRIVHFTEADVWENCDWTDEDKINKKIQEIAEDVKKDES